MIQRIYNHMHLKSIVLFVVFLYLTLSTQITFASRAGQNCKNGKAANCYANIQLMAVEFDLRGGGNAFRAEDTPTTATYSWFGNSLYQNHSQFGHVYASLSLHEDRPSIGTITSESPIGDPFFPANAANDLYMEMDLPDMGMHLYTTEPLHLTATIDNFFETDVVFVLAEDVPIYIQAEPEDVRIGEFLAGSEITAFPSRNISIERTDLALDNSTLTASWDVWNLTSESFEVFWSINATSAVDVLSESSGLAILEPEVPLELGVIASLGVWRPPEEIVLNVAKTSGALAYDYDAIVASIPAPAASKWALVILTAMLGIGISLLTARIWKATHC